MAAGRTTLNVSLTPALQRFVETRVASGRYQSASEVVREGLRLVEEHELNLRELRREIATGLEQAKRGELIDGEAVFRDLDRRARKPRRRAG
jgi:antitoxin ParD1/3/4